MRKQRVYESVGGYKSEVLNPISPVTRRGFTGTAITAGLARTMGGMIRPSGGDAAVPQVRNRAPGFCRIMVGDFEVTVVSDGTVTVPMDKLLTNISAEQVRTILGHANLKPQYEVSINTFLINSGSRLVLVDTGAGDLFGPKTGGKLVANLKAAGYEPSDLDAVLLTHIHADHSGGLMKDGKPVFPNTPIHVHKRDADYWLSTSNMEKAPDARKKTFQESISSFNPYAKAGKLFTFDGDTELMPGITSVQSPGHTPGHSLFSVESRGQKLLLWGDVIHVAEIQFPRPSVAIQFDVDPEHAIEQRKKAFADAVKQGCLVGGAHIVFPGLGHVRASGDDFTWIPLNYGLIPSPAVRV